MDYENRPIINATPKHLDRIKLKTNKSIGMDCYLFGAGYSDSHRSLAYNLGRQIQQHQLKHKLVYTGPIEVIKPYQLARVLETSKINGNHPTRRFKDYSGDLGDIGITVKESFQSALKLYESKYGYYPRFIVVMLITPKNISV